MGQKLFALLVVGLLIYIASPLLMPVVMGCVFAVLFFPWMEWLESKRLSTGKASAILTLGVTLCFLLPATLLIFLGAKAGLQQVRVWRDAPHEPGADFFENLVSMPFVQVAIEKLSRWFPISLNELTQTAEDLAKSTGMKIAEFLGNFFGQLPGMAMGLAVMVVSIFFFLHDGRSAVNFIRRSSIFSDKHTEGLLNTFGGMCRSVVLATLISGLAQSLMYSLACLVTGVSNFPLIGFVVFIASFIPLIGAAPITFGIAIFQFFTAGTAVGIILLITATAVGIVDNFVRPAVLRGSGNLHPLLAFVSAFGGLQVMGFAGVFLGPIIASMAIATIEILQDSDTG